jgi:hypothetical protein
MVKKKLRMRRERIGHPPGGVADNGAQVGSSKQPFKTRTLCQPRKECGTRKFKGISNGKSVRR